MSREALHTMAESLASIYDRHRDELVRFFMVRVGRDSAAAEDLLSETFLALARHVRAGRPVTHARGLLYAIARTRLIDFYRARSGSATVPLEADVLEWLEHTHADAHTEQYRDVQEVNRDILRVRTVLASLPEVEQQVLVMRHVDELSHAEIAVALDESERMVRRTLKRATAALRSAYRFRAAAQERKRERSRDSSISS